MARPYSSDLRERVVEAIDEERFGVSVSSAVRWHQAWRETGTFEAEFCGGSCSPLDDYEEEILALVEEQDDRTSTRWLRRCASGGYPEAARHCFVFWSVAALHTKKVLHAPEQEREDVARARRRWIREQGLLDSTHLIFIDETSVNTNMTRAYGRGLEGERVICRVPFAAWKTLTFVAALRCDGMTAPMLIKGAMNGEAQCLAPTLERGDIVIMDNVASHKVDGVQAAIEAAGAILRYLPPYSTDLNRIEAAYSACKAFLRKCAERTEQALSRRIGQYVRRLQPEACVNFFAHAGYAT